MSKLFLGDQDSEIEEVWNDVKQHFNTGIKYTSRLRLSRCYPGKYLEDTIRELVREELGIESGETYS
jgi:hypothetical protein